MTILTLMQSKAIDEIYALARTYGQIASREHMPQIKKKHLETVLVDLKKEAGINFVAQKVNPRTLRPTQLEFNKTKIAKNMDNWDNRPKPILVSSDNYILDGHHRWAAAFILGSPIRVYKLSAPMRVCIKALHDHELSFTKGLDESIIMEATKKVLPAKFSRLFVDMDGVLADFIRGSEHVLGFKFDDKEAQIARKLDNEGKWSLLAKHDKFWLNLPMMQDAMQLWNHVKDYHPIILSAPAKEMHTCVAEKKMWAKKHLGLPPDRIICVPAEDKAHFAKFGGKPAILIDDYVKNINAWNGAGGHAIHHTSAAHTIGELKRIGIV